MRLLVLLALALPAAQSAQPGAADTADRQWLVQLDAGDYQSAYQASAKTMQNATTEPAFAHAMKNARDPLGPVRSRTLAGSKETTTLPGLPDGHYVVAQYTTAFMRKASATETVVAEQSADGSWHVSGYHIR